MTRRLKCFGTDGEAQGQGQPRRGAQHTSQPNEGPSWAQSSVRERSVTHFKSKGALGDVVERRDQNEVTAKLMGATRCWSSVQTSLACVCVSFQKQKNKSIEIATVKQKLLRMLSNTKFYVSVSLESFEAL